MNATPLRSLILISLVLIPELLHATDFSGPNLPLPAPPPPAPGVDHDVSVNQPGSLVSITEPEIHSAATSDFPHLPTIQSGYQPMIMVNPCSPVTGMMQTGPMVVQGSITSGDLHALTRFRPSRSLADSRDPALFYRYTQERTEEAKILMHFPHGTNPTVAINFAEYPGEGDFRIFRTDIPAGKSRKYYLKAFGKGRVELGSGSSQIYKDGELAQYPYVILRGGDVLKLAYGGSSQQVSQQREDRLLELATQIQQNTTEIRSNLLTGSDLNTLKEDVTTAITQSEARIQTKLNTLVALVSQPAGTNSELPATRLELISPLKLQAAVNRESNIDNGKILSFGFMCEDSAKPLTLHFKDWNWKREGEFYSHAIVTVTIQDPVNPFLKATTAKQKIKIPTSGDMTLVASAFSTDEELDVLDIGKHIKGHPLGTKLILTPSVTLLTLEGEEGDKKPKLHTVWRSPQQIEVILKRID